MKHEIMGFIPYGEKNAVSMRQLSILTGWKLREVRAAVFQARCDGELICSSCARYASGYFRPETAADVERYKRMQESRIRSAARAVRSARRYLKQAKEGGSDGN